MIELVDREGLVGKYCSLALNGLDQPSISYYDESNESLKYAWRDGVGWHTETVDSNGHVGKYTSLALDILGRPCISYYDVSREDLKYAWQDGKTWRVYMPVLIRSE